MTVTFSTLISDTERHLLAGDRDQLNQLASDLSPTDTSVSFGFDLQGIQPGAYVAVDLEVMYVWDVNDTARTATVQRGMVGSTPATHTNGTVISANPKFSKYDIANAVNMEIRDLSSPPNGLWQVKNFIVTTKPVQKTYEIPAAATDLLDILEVRYQPPGPELRWDRIWGDQITVMRQMPQTGSTVTFPTTGMGFRIEKTLYPGRQMTVRYAAPFQELVDLDDDVMTVSGLTQSQLDIPPLGAAARLMGVREAKRTFAEAEVDTRRASETPPGAAARAAQTLLALLNERIRTEYMRLIQTWPALR